MCLWKTTLRPTWITHDNIQLHTSQEDLIWCLPILSARYWSIVGGYTNTRLLSFLLNRFFLGRVYIPGGRLTCTFTKLNVHSIALYSLNTKKLVYTSTCKHWFAIFLRTYQPYASSIRHRQCHAVHRRTWCDYDYAISADLRIHKPEIACGGDQ